MEYTWEDFGIKDVHIEARKLFDEDGYVVALYYMHNNLLDYVEVCISGLEYPKEIAKRLAVKLKDRLEEEPPF